MKLTDRFKRWIGVEKIEEIKLLNRYGARDIDDLWSMICMDRTAPEVAFWQTQARSKLALVISALNRTWKKRHRKSRALKEVNAKERYRNNAKARSYANAWQTAIAYHKKRTEQSV